MSSEYIGGKDDFSGGVLNPRDPVPVSLPRSVEPVRVRFSPPEGASLAETEPESNPLETTAPGGTPAESTVPDATPAGDEPSADPPSDMPDVDEQPTTPAAPDVDLTPIFGRGIPADLGLSDRGLRLQRRLTEPLPVAPSPRMARWVDRQIRIGIWGAARGGKTTYLAALRLATMRGSTVPGSWNMFGATEAASRFLIEKTDQLVQQRRFPMASAAVEKLSWRIHGDLSDEDTSAPRRGWRDRMRDMFGRDSGGGGQVDFILETQDVPGDRFLLGDDSPIDDTVLAHLCDSDGLLYLFDPLRDQTGGDGVDGNFEFFHRVLEHLMVRLDAAGKLDDGRLPHYAAVCVTKFDDPVVFAQAVEGEWVTWQPGAGQPHVPDRHAEGFFTWLCQQTPGAGADLIRNSFRRFFHPDRVAYFVSSSIGFFLGPGQIFDPSDYCNVIIVDGEPRIRDEVRPINVLEPLAGLERRIRTGFW